MITRRKPLRRTAIRRRQSPKVRKFVKPEQVAREARERRADRLFEKERRLCRYVTFMRAHGHCQRCGRPLVLLPSAAKHEFEIGHVHEEPPRSKGGDPTDPSITVLVCYFCHDMITTNKIMVVWNVPDIRALGGASFPPYVKGG